MIRGGYYVVSSGYCSNVITTQDGCSGTCEWTPLIMMIMRRRQSTCDGV